MLANGSFGVLSSLAPPLNQQVCNIAVTHAFLYLLATAEI